MQLFLASPNHAQKYLWQMSDMAVTMLSTEFIFPSATMEFVLVTLHMHCIRANSELPVFMFGFFSPLRYASPFFNEPS